MKLMNTFGHILNQTIQTELVFRVLRMDGTKLVMMVTSLKGGLRADTIFVNFMQLNLNITDAQDRVK